MSGFFCFHLSKTFGTKERTVNTLDDIHFRAQAGSFVCLVGPSGCGKTTLLRIIAGLLAATSGEVRFENGSHNGRPHCAMVFQDHGLFPWLSVIDNVAFGLETRGVPRHERQLRARAMIDRVRLGGFAQNYPHQLSGGMRQRVGIARAFLAEPDILLMDEPFGALDAQTRLILQEELLSIWREQQKTVVYVTHDIEEAILLGDRVLVLSGRPAHIRADIPISLPRPRDLLAGDHPEVQSIKKYAWQLIEEEARQSL